MKQEAEALVDELTRLIASARQINAGVEVREKKEQLQVLGKTVMELEHKGVPVPTDIERIVAGLREDLAGTQEAEDTLTYLSRALDDLARVIGPPIAPARGRRDPSDDDRLPTTSARRVLRGLIVEVLAERGGQATSRDVIAGVEERLQGRFLEGDLRPGSNGAPVWRNSTLGERYYMVRDGLLKNDSPRGLWELETGASEKT